MLQIKMELIAIVFVFLREKDWRDGEINNGSFGALVVRLIRFKGNG
jgi:hypothetical protein